MDRQQRYKLIDELCPDSFTGPTHICTMLSAKFGLEPLQLLKGLGITGMSIWEMYRNEYNGLNDPAAYENMYNGLLEAQAWLNYGYW